MNKMSTAARTALMNIGTMRQGSTCGPATPSAVVAELKSLGYLGAGGGLTRKGSIKRELIAEEQYEGMFA
jgi:hypothetical protein